MKGKRLAREVVDEVIEDRKNLEKIAGYDVRIMAYPGSGNNAERVSKIIKDRTKIKLARTTVSTYNFDLQDNLLRFNPTVYWVEDCLLEVVNNFMNKKTHGA